MSDEEDELHVHGGLRYAGATAVDDGNQGAVQLVHVALREESTSATGLVLHLRANTSTCVNTRLPRLNPVTSIVFSPCQLAWRCEERAS